MLRKQIGHLTIVSLKYFFDLDPAFSSHILLMTLVAFGFAKLFMSRISGSIQEGLLTVKYDFIELKSAAIATKERWDNSPARERLVNNVRLIRNNVSEIDIRNWRLK